MRELLRVAAIATMCVPVTLLSIGVVFGDEMQSIHYRIQSDSVNVGGGLSTSTSYSVETTFGESATGDAASATYSLHAGYQQMHEVFLSLETSGSVIMSPSISGITGGTANGSTTITVITDSVAGYQLTIASLSSPSLQSGVHSIADYTPGGNPDFVFITDVSDAHMGYSPSGEDITQWFRDDGGVCGTGSNDTDLACWDGLSTVPKVIASRSSSNHPQGSTTTVNFKIGIGSSVVQPGGVYTATTTVTALPL
jgi:hypothetical protein